MKLLLLASLVVAATAAPVSLSLHQHVAPKGARPLLSVQRKAMAKLDPSVPAWGDVWPVAIYWVFLSIGTPAVEYPVALDTGSFTLDIPMVGCQGCISTPPNAWYDVSKSATGSAQCPFGCTFSNSYQTCDLSDPTAVCTISGNYYADLVTLTGTSLKGVNITFGAINYQTTNFDQFKNIDGVVGIAATEDNQDFVTTMYQSGQLEANTFAMCLVEGSKSNGTFTLGGIDERLYTGTIQYTQNNPSQGGYGLNVNQFEIGGVVVANSQQQSAILDSGTNVLLVPDEMYDSMQSIFLNMCSTTPLHGICGSLGPNGTLFQGGCYTFTAAQMAQFPNIDIVLPELTLTMQPRDYLLGVDRPELLCLAIRSTGPGGFLIVGDTTMQEYYTIFDRTNNQIGWAPVNAKNCGSI